MRTLDDLVTAGKIRYVGFSNTPAWYTAQANTLALLRALDAGHRAAGRVFAAGTHGRGRADPAGAGRRDGRHAVEPAGRRLPVGQVHAATRRSARHQRGQITGARRPTPSSRSSTRSPPSPRRSAPTPAAVALAWLRSRPGVDRADRRRRAVSTTSTRNLASLDVELTDEQRRHAGRGLGAAARLPLRPQPRGRPDAAVRGRPRWTGRRRPSTRRCWRTRPATDRRPAAAGVAAQRTQQSAGGSGTPRRASRALSDWMIGKTSLFRSVPWAS